MNETLEAVVREHGTPAFVYVYDEVRARLAALREAFGERFEFGYAAKSNPHHGLLQRLREDVQGLDISSGGEWQRALDAGWDAARLGFTGPAKREGELEAAVAGGIGRIVLESIEEARLVHRLAGEQGRGQKVLVRIGPRKVPRGFGIQLAGKASQFGIDEEVLDEALDVILGLEHLELEGFHVFLGTQCLQPEPIAESYAIAAELFRDVCERFDLTPSRLVFGSGLGVPYHEGTEPVDLNEVARLALPGLDALRAQPRFQDSRWFLEMGRYLVGSAGTYLTRVLRIKESRGTRIAICDGGMNHHLAASGQLGSVIRRNFKMRVLGSRSGGAPVPHDVVGPLCTSIDLLGRKVELPPLEAGDVIAIENSGAYGPTASPVGFISHPHPNEFLV